MIAEIFKGNGNGRLSAPPSKSMAHRNLICGAFSESSTVSGVDMSKDIEATINCLKALGANVSIDGDKVTVGGLDMASVKDGCELYANESGSTLRFMIPICLLSNKEITIRGNEKSKLFSRPLDIYERICTENGLYFNVENSSVVLKGPIKNGEYEIPGDVSSQFISGMLFALPNVVGDSRITVTGEFESESYVDLTVSALSEFGVKIERPDRKTFLIKGKQHFESKEVTVEGDCSNAAFFEALKRLGSDIEIEGIRADTKQGDRVYPELFDKIDNKDFPIDISDTPDLAPILFAYAAVKGEGRFVGTRRLKIKESDRAEVMREELEKFGAKVSVGENDVTVKCDELLIPTEPLCAHNDHRIAMSMAVLSTVCGGTVLEAESVAKSFPDFFERMKALGFKVIMK